MRRLIPCFSPAPSSDNLKVLSVSKGEIAFLPYVFLITKEVKYFFTLKKKTGHMHFLFLEIISLSIISLLTLFRHCYKLQDEGESSRT